MPVRYDQDTKHDHRRKLRLAAAQHRRGLWVSRTQPLVLTWASMRLIHICR